MKYNKFRAGFWRLLILTLLAVLGTLAHLGWWVMSRLSQQDQVHLLGALMVAGLIITVALLLLGISIDLRVLRPIRTLSHSAEIIAHSNPGHRPEQELPYNHLIGPILNTVTQLANELYSARNEVAKALESGARQAQSQLQTLEAILQEMPDGVVVCDADARILLFNPAAARLIDEHGTLGMNRSIYEALTRPPLEHVLERTRHQQAAQQGLEHPFICSSLDGHVLLRCRLTPLPSGAGSNSFVLIFNDITHRTEETRKRDSLLRNMLNHFRAPLGSLRAAAETLAQHADMDAQTRGRFYGVLTEESEKLSASLDQIGLERRLMVSGHWHMLDILSEDLMLSLAERLSEPGITLESQSPPQWLKADSYAVIILLEHLLKRLQEHTKSDHFGFSAHHTDGRVYIDLIWSGEPVPNRVLNAWLDDRLTEAVGGISINDTLQVHDSDLWSQPSADPKQALLRIPMPASERRWQPGGDAGIDKNPPPSPVIACSGSWDNRLLSELDFTVFDTETTGLNPQEGDRIVSIAAVRVVQGKILRDEIFERYVNPGRAIPHSATRFHGINDDMVKDAPDILEVIPDFQRFVGDTVLVAHNAGFDMRFLREAMTGNPLPDCPVIDTLLLSVMLHDHTADHTLDSIAKRFGVELVGRHTAMGDALITADIFVRLLDILKARDIHSMAILREALNALEQHALNREP